MATSPSTPHAGQQARWQSLDPSGGIPFIDIGGSYLISGVTYNASILQGKNDPAIDALQTTVG